MQGKTLLCSAQPFGYGPISNLFSIVRRLGRHARCRLVLDGTHHVFPFLNPTVFCGVDYAADAAALDDLVASIRPAAILSSFDSQLVIAAARHGVPAFFQDGLFWFWTLRKSMQELKRRALELATVAPAERRLLLQELSPHEEVFVAHLLATKSYVQYTPNAEERLRELSRWANPHATGAVVYDGHPPAAWPGDHVLVSLGGGILPGVTLEQSADYAELVCQTLDAASRLHFVRYSWVVLINPFVLDPLRKRWVPGPDSRLDVQPSVCQDAIQDLQAHAVLVLSPPGLTTVYECAAMGVPLVFLPEQSSQWRNAECLAAYGYPVSGSFLHHLIPPLNPDEDPDGLVSVYSRGVPRFLQDPGPLLHDMIRRLKAMEDESARRHVAAAQRAAVLRMVNRFDGASEIASDIAAQMR